MTHGARRACGCRRARLARTRGTVASRVLRSGGCALNARASKTEVVGFKSIDARERTKERKKLSLHACDYVPRSSPADFAARAAARMAATADLALNIYVLAPATGARAARRRVANPSRGRSKRVSYRHRRLHARGTKRFHVVFDRFVVGARARPPPDKYAANHPRSSLSHPDRWWSSRR